MSFAALLKNKINSYDLIEFMRDFRVVKGKDGSYINISRNQSVNAKIKKMTELTNLDALYFSEKEVENLFKNSMLIKSEYQVLKKTVPKPSHFYPNFFSKKSHGKNSFLICYVPQKITVQFITHLLVMIELLKEMQYNLFDSFNATQVPQSLIIQGVWYL